MFLLLTSPTSRNLYSFASSPKTAVAIPVTSETTVPLPTCPSEIPCCCSTPSTVVNPSRIPAALVFGCPTIRPISSAILLLSLLNHSNVVGLCRRSHRHRRAQLRCDRIRPVTAHCGCTLAGFPPVPLI